MEDLGDYMLGSNIVWRGVILITAYISGAGDGVVVSQVNADVQVRLGQHINSHIFT